MDFKVDLMTPLPLSCSLSLSHTHTHKFKDLHRGVYVERDVSLLSDLSLVWSLPPPPRSSLRGAVKMTTFHHFAV